MSSQMIHTPCCDRKNSERAFLFDIVANKRNSVDVDKFDYLARGAINIPHFI